MGGAGALGDLRLRRRSTRSAAIQIHAFNESCCDGRKYLPRREFVALGEVDGRETGRDAAYRCVRPTAVGVCSRDLGPRRRPWGYVG